MPNGTSKGTRSPIIREAGPKDDVIVGELLVRAFLGQYARKHPEIRLPAERLADLRNQKDRRSKATVFVAEIEGNIIGTVAVYRWGAKGTEAWIEGGANLRLLAIDVGYQGLGLSRQLLDRAEQCAANWLAPVICLHVRRGVEGVARLYQSRGYVREDAGDIDHGQLFLEGYVLRL